MTSRLGFIVAGELYAPGDFMYTHVERALALDFALLKKHLNGDSLYVSEPNLRLEPVLDETLSGGVHDSSAELSKPRILELADQFAEKYFHDDKWNERLAPDFISVITGRPCFPAVSKSQQDLRSGLVLLLSYDLQTLHWSIMNLSGVVHEMGEVAKERDQMNALFRYRYGCMSLADVGLSPLDDQLIPLKPFMLPIKRVFDTLVTLTLCLLMSPLIIGLTLVMAFGDGPIFYSQRRIGRNGRIFRCQKFTTMVPNAERLLADLLAADPNARAEWQQYEKLRNDPRITKLGRFLRKTSLDELPQFFNVLKGDMSLVGPRPMAVHERERWRGLYRSYAAVRPGVTGPWQIYHRSDNNYEARIDNMESYIASWSLLMDLKYLVLTIVVPFSGKGA